MQKVATELHEWRRKKSPRKRTCETEKKAKEATEAEVAVPQEQQQEISKNNSTHSWLKWTAYSPEAANRQQQQLVKD